MRTLRAFTVHSDGCNSFSSLLQFTYNEASYRMYDHMIPYPEGELGSGNHKLIIKKALFLLIGCVKNVIDWKKHLILELSDSLMD